MLSVEEKIMNISDMFEDTAKSYAAEAGAEEMAGWMKQRMIEKAVEYLIFNTHDYYDGDSEFAVCNWLKRDEFIENFKQAMQEE